MNRERYQVDRDGKGGDHHAVLTVTREVADEVVHPRQEGNVVAAVEPSSSQSLPGSPAPHSDTRDRT